METQKHETTTGKSGDATKADPVDAARKVVDDSIGLDAHTKRLVDAAEKHINGLVREVIVRQEAIADYVVEELFGGDTLSALSPNRSPPPTFSALRQRADDTLALSRGKLVQATRIGALNRHLAGTPWTGLTWSVKVELLPLVGADGDLSSLKEGAKLASKGLGVRAVREWVAKKAAGGEPGAEDANDATAPSIASSRKVFEVAARFSKAADRRRWLDRAEKLPAGERDALLSGLRSAAKQLSKLLSDFESALQEA